MPYNRWTRSISFASSSEHTHVTQNVKLIEKNLFLKGKLIKAYQFTLTWTFLDMVCHPVPQVTQWHCHNFKHQQTPRNGSSSLNFQSPLAARLRVNTEKPGGLIPITPEHKPLDKFPGKLHSISRLATSFRRSGILLLSLRATVLTGTSLSPSS